jgi:hypothetical protein
MKTVFIILVCALAFNISSCARRVVVVSNPPATTTTIIRTAPPHHKIVVVRGKRYYSWDGHYYRKTRRGFVIVKL